MAEISLPERLRAAADLIDAHPDVRFKAETTFPDDGTIYLKCFDPNNAQQLATLAAQLGGRWEKQTDDNFFRLVATVRPGVECHLIALRIQVCQRVVTGTRKETVTEPDPELVAQLPAITRTEMVEEVEWVCPDSLLAEKATA